MLAESVQTITICWAVLRETLPQGNKKNVGTRWAKSLTDFKLHATCANIMQHYPTWCTNGHNMLRPFAQALRYDTNRELLLVYVSLTEW